MFDCLLLQSDWFRVKNELWKCRLGNCPCRLQDEGDFCTTHQNTTKTKTDAGESVVRLEAFSFEVIKRSRKKQGGNHVIFRFALIARITGSGCEEGRKSDIYKSTRKSFLRILRQRIKENFSCKERIKLLKTHFNALTGNKSQIKIVRKSEIGCKSMDRAIERTFGCWVANDTTIYIFTQKVQQTHAKKCHRNTTEVW